MASDLRNKMNASGKSALKPLPFDFPGVEGVTIRAIGSDERDYLELSRVPQRKGQNVDLKQYRSMHVAVFLGDENGERVYDDSQNSLNEIGKWTGTLVDEIFELGLTHNKMKMGEALEEAKKNSEEREPSGSI